MELFYRMFFPILLFTVTADENMDTVVIETNLGLIKGLKGKHQTMEQFLYEFRGIPYGKSTEGQQRFRKPVPHGRWKDVLDATEYGAACPQVLPDILKDLKPKQMSEDCLFLNVYVPYDIKRSNDMSVMVWIHGGGLTNGYSNQYDGGKIAMEGGVIVVTVNYRLGVFGFLAVDDPAAKGNYGLWDQKLAIQWVHDNIQIFGGNPESVTIFGESAGGWSVSFQSLIPSNEGLFQRVIAQSGVVSRSNILNISTMYKSNEEISEKLRCPMTDAVVFTDCLRDKSMDELLASSVSFISSADDSILFHVPFQPVVDGELFLDHPLKELENSESDVAKFFKSLDILIGTTSNEGNLLYLVTGPEMQERYGFNISESIPLEFICQAMVTPYVKRYLDGGVYLSKEICEFYRAGTSDEQSLRATDCYADLMFVYPTVKMLEHHCRLGGRTYQYQFSTISSKPISIAPAPKWFKGSPHAADLQYLFDISKLVPSFKMELNEEEINLSRKVIRYWTNFAKFGNPNGNEVEVSWKPFDLIDRSYLDIDIPLTQGQSLRKEMLNFYDKILPSLNHKTNRDEL